MQELERNLRYYLYARKSSESEDRQVVSIERQIEELQRFAERYNLHIIGDPIDERKSAKAPGRPKFNQMLADIHAGKADAILAWKLDRLSRNPVDSGNLKWMLQQNVIRLIKTHERDYLPGDNVLTIGVEMDMANQYVRDLSVYAKSGMKKAARDGWYPSRAPLGYLNNKDVTARDSRILIDPERFELLKKIFSKVLTGAHTPAAVYRMAIDEFGLRTLKGYKPEMSAFYHMLHNPFYAGKYWWPKENGELYTGKHTPLITWDEYEQIQTIVSKKTKSRLQKHIFTFRGLIRCGECGAAITAEKQLRARKRKGDVILHTYYRCTKKVKPCTQKFITESDLELQIKQKISEITISPDFLNLALEWIHEDREEEKESFQKNIQHYQTKLSHCTRELEKKFEDYAQGKLDAEDYQKVKEILYREKARLEELINSENHASTGWVEKAERVLHFAQTAKERFDTGTLNDKREILTELGSNFSLLAGVLHLDVAPHYVMLQNLQPAVANDIVRLEQSESSNGTTKKTDQKSDILIWLPRLDSNQ